MALGLQTGGGGGSDRVPYVKYDARAGRMFRVDRSEVGGMWQTDSVDITSVAQFVPDLANIEVGWINYSDQGPVKAMAVLGKAPIPPRPEGVNDKGKAAFRQGFNLMLALSKESGGGIREFNSNAGCVIEAMDQLHDAFSAAPECKAGKLPIVKIAATYPVKSGQSTNYKPDFQIVGWCDRPASLPVPQVSSASAPAAPAAAPPSTGSTIVAPPTAAPVPVPEPAGAGANDFG